MTPMTETATVCCLCIINDIHYRFIYRCLIYLIFNVNHFETQVEIKNKLYCIIVMENGIFFIATFFRQVLFCSCDEWNEGPVSLLALSLNSDPSAGISFPSCNNLEVTHLPKTSCDWLAVIYTDMLSSPIQWVWEWDFFFLLTDI